MPVPKIYFAAYLASINTSIKPLCGNRKSAQRYVDRITASDWWQTNVPGFWDYDDPAPARVWVWEGGTAEGGEMDPAYVVVLRDEEIPFITIGRGEVNDPHIPAIADKWVILHELAHIMTNSTDDPGHHGRGFCLNYIALVRQYLGPQASRALIDWSRYFKIRLDYRLLVS